jgi:hypothetical protein
MIMTSFFRGIRLALFALLAVSAAARADGPYVIRDAAGKLEAWWVEQAATGAHKRSEAATEGGTLTVPGVGSLPALRVKLRPAADAVPDEVTLAAKSRLFVVADTHGEYEILARMLQRHGVVDAALHWSFGRGHLVILGDVLDRGPHHTEILWLLYALEAEARKAGGAVHLLLGNHEAMVLTGDIRYLHPKYRQTAQVLGVASYSQLLDAQSVLGQWLRSKAAVQKLGGYLCLHGGISPELLARGLSLRQINETVRAVLAGRAPAPGESADRAGFLFGPSGPLWYRGYFPGSGGAAASPADIEQIRMFFDVEKVLVGHTRVPTLSPLFGGAVIAVQVYPRALPDGEVEFEALLIRDGKLFRARADGRTELLQN